MFCGGLTCHPATPVLNWVHQGGGENQRSLADLERWLSAPRIGAPNFPSFGSLGHPCSAGKIAGKKNGGSVDWQTKMEIGWHKRHVSAELQGVQVSFFYMCRIVCCELWNMLVETRPSLISHSLVVCQLQSLQYPSTLWWIWWIQNACLTSCGEIKSRISAKGVESQKNIQKHALKQYFSTTFLALHIGGSTIEVRYRSNSSKASKPNHGKIMKNHEKILALPWNSRSNHPPKKSQLTTCPTNSPRHCRSKGRIFNFPSTGFED